MASEISTANRVSEGDLQVLQNLGISVVNQRPMKVQVVRWLRPPSGRLKLNLDGSCRGNPSIGGGGGILWNHEGSLVFAFSSFFGSCTNNKVELRAVVEGIEICCQRGHFFIDLECDSLVVVSWLVGRYCTVWYLWDFRDQLMSPLEGFEITIMHLSKEGNKVADELARCGALGEEFLVSEVAQLTRSLQGL